MTTEGLEPAKAHTPWRHARTAAVVLCLSVYLILGLYTELKLIGVKPLPEKLIEDFQYYKQAYSAVRAGGDPYAVRDIGTGFLYPPPALLVVGLFARIPARVFMLRVAVLVATNLLLLSSIIAGVARRYGYSLSDVWWWFPLGLGFAPFLEVLHLGQINVITQFGVFLMLLLEELTPFAGGLGLALGVITKVTPLAYLGYLLAGRNLKAITGAAVGLAVLSLLAGLIYGWQPFVTYAGVLRFLLGAFPGDPNAQSFAAVVQGHGLMAGLAPQLVQRGLSVYLLLVFAASAVCTYLTRWREPLFIVLGFGLALMPNVMWYHHYVFFLLPVFVWLAWSRMKPAVIAWCFVGLCLIQVDRAYSFLAASHGLLAHGFGHLSILVVLACQVRRTVAHLRSGARIRQLLRFG